jgi:hypothetical protein
VGTTCGASIRDFGQGLWWAIVTVTTVGDGDRYPVAPMGQRVAVVLTLAGIGLIGVRTATVASYFVDRKKTRLTCDWPGSRPCSSNSSRISCRSVCRAERAGPPTRGVMAQSENTDRVSG